MSHFSMLETVFLGAALACGAFALALIAAVVQRSMSGPTAGPASMVREVVPARRTQT